MNNKSQLPRDIHLLTIDSLLFDLIGGRAVATAKDKQFSINSDDARAVLDWYRRNRGKWAGNLVAGDVEAIIDAVGTAPPVLENSTDEGPAHAIKVLQLVKVVAHRFAGLHVYGRSTEPPETFAFEFSKAVTLLEGANGSGKTSIANAVVWCLTGHLIRSQRPPEEGPTEFNCEVTRSDDALSTHLISVITPMPHKTSDLPADGEPIPADSWVELTLADTDGNTFPPIRRQQTRSPRGKIIETPPDFDTIGVDPIAWRIATTMPALLPFLTVGSTSQLGEAVARLTGLADLVDLAKHAGKVSERIAKRTTKELEAERTAIAERYQQAAADLAGAITECPAIAFEGSAPAVDAKDARDGIQTIKEHFTTLKATALAAAREVLGETFDPENKKVRDDLEASIRPAIEQLSRHLGELPSIARLLSLSVNDDDVAMIVKLMAQIDAEARMLAELAVSPDRARRAQLYARVSAWMHEHGHAEDGTCPVCIGPLTDVCDPVTGNAISDHLAEAARDREVIARTVVEWSSHWCGRLLQDLPASIAAEARVDLPAAPTDLLRAALIDELFGTEAFCGTLSALHADAAALVDERLTTLPTYEEPPFLALPASLIREAATLQQMLNRTSRALAFAQWRGANAEALKGFVHAVRRGQDGAADADRAIGRRLSSLLEIVEGVAPLNTALEYVRRLEVARVEHVSKQERIAACGKAVVALDLLIPLGNLAQSQVETLRNKLHDRSEYWRRATYRNATTFAPDLTGTGMDARGVLELKVGREGFSAPAQHVSNASALRGALLGFFLAFREHVLTTRGGLSLLVLDDPQELLDNDNRERLARGLAGLAEAGAQLLVTTHDRKFARSLVAENRAADRVEHLAVHPVNAVRPTLAVSPAIEEVDRRRQAFHERPDSAPDAQNYAADLRVFLESRLGDLFDDTAHPAYATSTKSLTLIPLMDRLRGLASSGAGELFANPVVRRFVEDAALAEGAEPRRILNMSHHDKASISYMDVRNVETDFVRLRTGIEKVHEQFRLHRWREPLTPSGSAANTTPLKSIVKPKFLVPLCPDIAAFVGDLPEGGSQDIAIDRIDSGWFEGKALFYIRGDTLGFAIPGGAVAIVEAEPYPGRDQNLVIAKYRDQILARRLVTSRGAIGISLAAQMPDPRMRRPTLTFDESKLRLYRIVGAIFTDMPPPPGGGEATPIDAVPELEHVKMGYRVREDSAVPLVLPGQVILGGVELPIVDLDRWENKLVAVTLDDGTSILKRVGARLPGNLGHLRQFETVGGLGSSVVVATEVTDTASSAPIMVTARKIIGVLYDYG